MKPHCVAIKHNLCCHITHNTFVQNLLIHTCTHDSHILFLLDILLYLFFTGRRRHDGRPHGRHGRHEPPPHVPAGHEVPPRRGQARGRRGASTPTSGCRGQVPRVVLHVRRKKSACQKYRNELKNRIGSNTKKSVRRRETQDIRRGN